MFKPSIPRKIFETTFFDVLYSALAQDFFSMYYTLHSHKTKEYYEKQMSYVSSFIFLRDDLIEAILFMNRL